MVVQLELALSSLFPLAFYQSVWVAFAWLAVGVAEERPAGCSLTSSSLFLLLSFSFSRGCRMKEEEEGLSFFSLPEQSLRDRAPLALSSLWLFPSSSSLKWLKRLLVAAGFLLYPRRALYFLLKLKAGAEVDELFLQMPQTLLKI